MAYVGFELVQADNTVKDVSDLTIPAEAQGAELQADTNEVRYTMDGATNPTTTSGMMIALTHMPKPFGITDIRNIRFIRDGGVNGNILIHYFAGRDI